jgi:MoaA/NifB/PqqE/SkfB family radical SAM enzyme
VTVESVAENLPELKKLGVKVIDFTGGEPLLHRQLPEILELAKKQGFITTLTTNGLLYPKKARDLVGLIDMLHFSLDSFDQQQHDEMRGVACYEAVLKSIEVAKALGEKPDILFTAFKNNLEQIEQVYKNISLPNNLVLILNPVFDYNQVETGRALDNADLDYLSTWGKKPRIYLNDGFIELLKDGGNKITSPVCKADSSTIVISPENRLIAPCYHLELETFSLEKGLAEVYHSEEVQAALGRAGREEACEGCTINCYMQPSFAVEINKYFWRALPSTIKYNRMKGTWKQLIS